MTKVTPLQAKMLNRIARDEYQPVNGDLPKTYADTSEVWSMYIIKTPEQKGVATSLINAGLISCYVDPKHPRDNTVRLTEAGFAAWQALKIDEAY